MNYLRKGRKLRASGEIIDKRPDGMVKVKPTREDWGCVWLTPEEIEAGKDKPAYVPRPKPDAPDKPKRVRKPKPPPVPRWKQLVERVRVFEVDHHPRGWPGVRMDFLTELANELEAAHAGLL